MMPYVLTALTPRPRSMSAARLSVMNSRRLLRSKRSYSASRRRAATGPMLPATVTRFDSMAARNVTAWKRGRSTSVA